MSLTNPACRSQYTGNGTTTAFATGFEFLYNSSVTVTLTDLSGNTTPLTQGTDYTVSGVGVSAGGTVTCTVAPTSGYLVTVIRVSPNTQQITFVPNDELPASSLENGLDLLTMQVQELNSPGGTVDRAIKYSPSEPAGYNSLLPGPAVRAGKTLGFDINGAFYLYNDAGQARGYWTTATAYNYRDLVTNSANQNLYSVTQNYTSGASVAADVSSGYLRLIINSTLLVGATGATGAAGTNGTNGAAATIAVGTTTTVAAGTPASVTNSGSSSAATFNFSIPQGPAGSNGSAGAAATIAVGTVSTGAAGSSATVSNSGSSSAAVFNFSIPQGQPGTSAGVVTVKVQKFTSSGTYTPSTGMLYCIVECQGGGGAGGGATPATGSTSAGGGGSGGNYVRSIFSAATIGASQAVTIGGGGTGGTGAGLPGAATSLGTAPLATAGGGGGAGNGTGATSPVWDGFAANTSTGSDTSNILSLYGSPGAWGVSFGPTGALSGSGGNSTLGAGGVSVRYVGGGAGQPGQGYGGGGSGSVAGPTGASSSGGSGAPGILIVTEFCSQ